jgi:CheY-like chemotaxis protein
MTEQRAIKPDPTAPTVPIPRRVLVIDDEQVVCVSCRRSLQSSGYEVVTCTDPIDGLERAQRECFDIILLDILMPRMGGVE